MEKLAKFMKKWSNLCKIGLQSGKNINYYGKWSFSVENLSENTQKGCFLWKNGQNLWKNGQN